MITVVNYRPINGIIQKSVRQEFAAKWHLRCDSSVVEKASHYPRARQWLHDGFNSHGRYSDLQLTPPGPANRSARAPM
jgi:hypothetical protein